LRRERWKINFYVKQLCVPISDVRIGPGQLIECLGEQLYHFLNKKYVLWNVYLPNAVSVPTMYHNTKQQVATYDSTPGDLTLPPIQWRVSSWDRGRFKVIEGQRSRCQSVETDGSPLLAPSHFCCRSLFLYDTSTTGVWWLL